MSAAVSVFKLIVQRVSASCSNTKSKT